MLQETLIVTILLLIAGLTGPVVAAPVGENLTDQAWVQDNWTITVENGEASVDRQLEIDAELSSLMRGAPQLDAALLSHGLEKMGAYEVDCQQDDLDQKISISCHYHQPVIQGENVTHLLLPWGTFQTILADIPLEMAQGVGIQTIGEVSVPGLFVSLPPSWEQTYADGGFSQRTYNLTSPANLTAGGKIVIPPGGLPISADLEPTQISFAANYLPEPITWITLFLCLAITLVAIRHLLPVSAQLVRKPQLWQPGFERIPFLLRWFVHLLAAIFSWLKRNWPMLLNGLVGLSLVLWGGQIILAAWGLSRMADLAQIVIRPFDFLEFMPLLLPVKEMHGPAWLVAMFIIGVLLPALGIGLLVRYQPARRLVIAALLALLCGFILVWPRLILVPPLLPLQFETTAGFGGLFLLGLAVLTRGLIHVQFRRYYLRIDE